MMIITTTYCLHSDKSDNHYRGQQLGLSEEALNEFVYTCYEVQLTLEVDTETGKSTIIEVDGRKVL